MSSWLLASTAEQHQLHNQQLAQLAAVQSSFELLQLPGSLSSLLLPDGVLAAVRVWSSLQEEQMCQGYSK
jgi:hypothetical protein